jgi:hypothetical protein
MMTRHAWRTMKACAADGSDRASAMRVLSSLAGTTIGSGKMDKRSFVMRKLQELSGSLY